MRLLFLSVFILQSTICVSIQKDSIRVNRDFAEGDRLALAGKFPEAISLLTKSAASYSELQMWKRCAQSYQKLTECYIHVSRLDEATASAKKALQTAREHLSENSAEEASSYISLSFIKRSQGLYDPALDYLQKALTIRKKALPEGDAGFAEIYSMTGYLYYSKGYYDTALQSYEKAVAIGLKLGHDFIIGSCYNEMGVTLMEMGDYNQALNYFARCRILAEKHFGTEHPHTASVFANLATTYRKQGNFEEALRWQKIVLGIRQRLTGPNSLHTAHTHNSLGLTLTGLGEYDSALTHLKQALKINTLIAGPESHQAGISAKNIGDAFLANRKVDSALFYFNKALAIAIKSLGKKHPNVANTYNSMARACLDTKDFGMALSYAEKAIASNTRDQEKPWSRKLRLSQFLHSTAMLESLSLKGLALQGLSSPTEAPKYLLKAMDNYRLADTLVQLVRLSHRAHSDKIEAAKISVQIYEGAIEAAIKLFDNTKSDKYQEQLFYFLEKSKSGALRETLANTSAKNFARIPEDILRLEKEINADIASHYAKIQQYAASGKPSEELQNFERLLTVAQHKRDSLTVVLEKNYPKYYELKFNDKVIGLKELQDRLDSETIVLEYFEGEDALYLFAITQNSLKHYRLLERERIAGLIENMRTSLNPELALSQPTRSHDLFLTSAFGLYKAVVSPAAAEMAKKTNLYIIPDGQLGYIPFDVLLTDQQPDKNTSYQELPYLLNQFNSSYGYSATLIFNEDDKKRDFDSDYLAFAPDYEDRLKDSTAFLAVGRFRDQVAPLAWTGAEVTSIGKFWNGTSFIGKSAEEEMFKSMAGKSSILHLAMHALVDDQRPMESKLVFSKGSGNEEDGFLHAYELFNMRIPAKLVVLSACETGYGKLQKGEGIMSLGRAFAYAGTPSVVMSHWVVDDEATAVLMEHFYENLSKGLRKDEALRNAKRKYLKNAHPLKQSPAFWSGFVVLGDVQPVTENSSTTLVLVLASILGAAPLILFYKRYQTSSQKKSKKISS